MDDPIKINGGYVVFARAALDSQLWQCGPDALRLAMYLLLQARFNPIPKKYPGFIVSRGDVLTSLSTISEDCSWFENRMIRKWSRGKVGRLLSTLNKIGFCSSISDTYGTHLNICKYDLYQDLNKYKSDNNGTTPDNGGYETERHRTLVDHNSKKVQEGKERKEVTTYSPESDEIKIAERLFSEIIKRHPNHKRPNFDLWAKSVDLMIRVDKRSIQDIEDVIIWSQEDSFWQNNILSTSKLREKFDQLILKMKQCSKAQPLSSAGMKTAAAAKQFIEQMRAQDERDRL